MEASQKSEVSDVSPFSIDTVVFNESPETLIVPTYKYDNCCKDFTPIVQYGDFGIIKDRNGNVCFALVDTISEVIPHEAPYPRLTTYTPGISHVREYTRVEDVFALFRSHGISNVVHRQ